MILNRPWPEDLDPAAAGFKTWTETILRRHGYWDDPTLLDTLSVDEFLALENVGAVILSDLVEKGNAAITRHENLPPRSAALIATEEVVAAAGPRSGHTTLPAR
jgi:hypothetical protein